MKVIFLLSEKKLGIDRCPIDRISTLQNSIIITLLDPRSNGPTVYRSIGLSDPRSKGPAVYRTFGLNDPRLYGTLGLTDHRSIRPSL